MEKSNHPGHRARSARPGMGQSRCDRHGHRDRDGGPESDSESSWMLFEGHAPGRRGRPSHGVLLVTPNPSHWHSGLETRNVTVACQSR
jgi:hypothetical protein